MGVSPCFKANSVFSLYGVLSSNPQDADSEGSYCHKATYIDTYFTRAGVETIGEPFGFIGDGQDQGMTVKVMMVKEMTVKVMMVKEMTVKEMTVKEMTATMDIIRQARIVRMMAMMMDDGGEQDGDGDGYNAEDHTSYGTGCRSKAYVYDSFEGSFCSAHMVKETIDYLDTFNENMGSLTCTQIYDGSNNNDGGGDDSLLDILSKSHSCSVDIYPNDCVDPYGLKHKYDTALRNAVSKQGTANVVAGAESGLKWTTLILFMVGFVLLASDCYLRRKISSTNKDDPSEAKSTSSLSSPAVFVRKVSSNISKTAESIKESIQEYADEEKDLPPMTTEDYVVPAEEPVGTDEEKDLPPTTTGDYVVAAEEPAGTDKEEALPPTSTGDYGVPVEEPSVAASASTQSEDESKFKSNEPTPEELPVDKGEASLPPPPRSGSKQYKRPRLHVVTKKLFGSSNKKGNLYYEDA